MKTKDKICALIRHDEFTTGTIIAKELGITRSFVSKCVQELQADGVQIITKRQHGYKFADDYDYINKYKIEKALETKYIGKELIILNKVNSTNNFAKKLAKTDFINGTVVVADCQTGGRGRANRQFLSPHNFGLYYSVLLKPDFPIELSQLITACAAVATAEVIDEIGNVDTKIKWVNDIYLGGKKMVGILTEASVGVEAGTLDYVIIGIGINMYDVTKSLPPKLHTIATSLENETGYHIPRDYVIAKLSNNLEKHLNNISSGEFLKVYKEKSIIIGKKVFITKNNENIQVTAIDIDDKAALVVKFDDGHIEHLNSGEARLVPGQISTFC